MNRSTRGRPGRKRGKLSSRSWARWPSERLLDLRLCDLDLKIAGTVVAERIDQLRLELERHDLRFRPYFWLSDDWFTPDGSTGTAIPFYLAHPRLVRLERNQIGLVEGGTRTWCMKLLRHEAGHALEHAFRLNRRRRWQKLFGRSSHSYPRFYRPNPFSKRYVQHLEYWYAQSHPDEDFAETFAVWLQPGSRWRRRYQGWPALKKLEYVNELMEEIAGRTPPVRTRSFEEPLGSLKKTLREHYARKKEGYTWRYSSDYDRDLERLFTTARDRRSRESASAFIRRVLPEVKRLVHPWIGDHRYQLEHVLTDMIGRCRELRLFTDRGSRNLAVKFAIMLTRHTMDSLYRHRYWVEL